MNRAVNTIYYKGEFHPINNSMLLFLGSGEIVDKQYAMWSLVVFKGDRVNDSEFSEHYLDVEFLTPLSYTENGKISLLDTQSELIFSKVHHFRLFTKTQDVTMQDIGTVTIQKLTKTADFVDFSMYVSIGEELLEIQYQGPTKLIVMNN